jgi:hypothetical protein
MCRLQANRSTNSGLIRSFPRFDTNAPSVTSLKSGKSELRTRSNQVVSDLLLMLKKLVRYDDANSVLTEIVFLRITFSVAIVSGQWIRAAGLERSA